MCCTSYVSRQHVFISRFNKYTSDYSCIVCIPEPGHLCISASHLFAQRVLQPTHPPSPSLVSPTLPTSRHAMSWNEWPAVRCAGADLFPRSAAEECSRQLPVASSWVMTCANEQSCAINAKTCEAGCALSDGKEEALLQRGCGSGGVHSWHNVRSASDPELRVECPAPSGPGRQPAPQQCVTDADCPGSYCMDDPTKVPPYVCHA